MITEEYVDDEEDDLNTDKYLVMCYRCKLTLHDLEMMTVGMCLDYIQEYILALQNQNKPRKRKATQADFDSF